VITHSLTERERRKVMNRQEIVMRWVALAPLALVAIAMFSQWS
jgi:hypothetical protein